MLNINCIKTKLWCNIQSLVFVGLSSTYDCIEWKWWRKVTSDDVEFSLNQKPNCKLIIHHQTARLTTIYSNGAWAAITLQLKSAITTGHEFSTTTLHNIASLWPSLCESNRNSRSRKEILKPQAKGNLIFFYDCDHYVAAEWELLKMSLSQQEFCCCARRIFTALPKHI